MEDFTPSERLVILALRLNTSLSTPDLLTEMGLKDAKHLTRTCRALQMTGLITSREDNGVTVLTLAETAAR